MARNYTIENLLDCIASLEPIQASRIAGEINTTLFFSSCPEDLSACKWTGNPPRSCNMDVLLKVITNDITDCGELQRLHACASVIAGLDDDESSISTSSISLAESSSSTSSIDELFSCFTHAVKTPQYHETGSNTATIIMDPLAGSVVWADVILNGTMVMFLHSQTGGGNGTLSLNNNTGEVTYIPDPAGTDGGTVVYLHIEYLDTNTSCSVDVYLHLVITEETSTD